MDSIMLSKTKVNLKLKAIHNRNRFGDSIFWLSKTKVNLKLKAIHNY